MKKIFLSLLVCVCWIETKAQTVYQFLYVEGKITHKNAPLVLAQYYDSQTKVKLEGKLAVFYDTLNKKIATIRTALPDSIGGIAKATNIAGFKCCASTFSFFTAYPDKPYPLLYDNTILTFDEKEYLTKIGDNGVLIYAFKDTTGARRVKGISPTNIEKDNGFDLGKMLKDFRIDSIAFYKGERDSQGSIKNRKLIAKRAIQKIETPILKKQLSFLVDILKRRYPKKDRTKEDKETMQELLSNFIYELYGYPDEENLRKWLREQFYLDLGW